MRRKILNLYVLIDCVPMCDTRMQYFNRLIT